jgi:hypothetical protein
VKDQYKEAETISPNDFAEKLQANCPLRYKNMQFLDQVGVPEAP